MGGRDSTLQAETTTATIFLLFLSSFLEQLAALTVERASARVAQK